MIERQPERTILVWGHRADRPASTAWNIGSSHVEQTSSIWPSIRHALNYAVGMREDREAEDLHPWIRTMQGHVYSPATIALLAEVMMQSNGRPRGQAAA